MIRHDNGAINFQIAASGTADAAISFTQAMTLDASGRLSVGTTATVSGITLNVSGGINSTNGALNVSGNGGFYNAVNKFGVDNNGGASRLYSSGPNSSTRGSYEFHITDSVGTLDSVAATISADGTFRVKGAGTAGSTDAFQVAGTAPADAARIDSSGNLLVGQTSAGLDDSKSITLSKQFGVVYVNHLTGQTTGDQYAIFAYAGSLIGSITQSGTTAVLYNTTSDQRLKENIQDAAPASALIDSLQVRQFDWKADGSHQRYGFVAQELVTVAPEAVHQPTKPDDMMAVDYSKLVPMLVKEIQDLRARVASLESSTLQ
jgi:hypothetical protein